MKEMVKNLITSTNDILENVFGIRIIRRRGIALGISRFIDWKQLDRLPAIDTLIDVGVGPDGTPDLYERFASQKLILIDPLDEAEAFVNNEMTDRDAMFFKVALGSETSELVINVEEDFGRSTLLEVTDINYVSEPIDKRIVPVRKLDDLLSNQVGLGRVGIKIDTEGFELDVVLGATETLRSAKFVIAEVRHNHESFKGGYSLHEFVNAMHENGFVLSMIMTAKPLIADLCFEPKAELG